MNKRLIRFASMLLMVFAAALTVEAQGPAPTQAIYTGHLRINGDVPAGGAVIQILNESMQWIRDTHYDTTSGAYGVSLFGSDGLAEGAPIMFRVMWSGGSFIAHTWGAPALYHGTPLDPPMPPDPITIDLTNNNPPAFTSTPPDNAKEDSTFHYVLTANDPDGDPFTFGFVAGPAWLHLDTASATLSGVPGAGDVGDAQVTVNVDDHLYLGTATQVFTLHVLHTNHNPIIRSKNPAVAYVDSPYVYQVTAIDVDHDVLDYHILAGPQWLHADTATGLVSGTPSAGDEGDTSFTILVTDGNGGSAQQDCRLSVVFANRPPSSFRQIEPKDSGTVNFPGPFALRWTRAKDPDVHDTLRYIVRITLEMGPFSLDTAFVTMDSVIVIPDLPLPPHQHVVVLVHWSVTATDGKFLVNASNAPGVFKLDIQAGVSDGGVLPKEFGLGQNFPNPFNPTTMVSYSLPQGADVRIAIYNMLGVQVRALVGGHHEAGVYAVEWNGRNDDGGQVASGVYLYRILAVGADETSFTVTKKMLLAK